MAPHALARNARHPATSVCVNSVRTKPPAYELHEHQNELCYIYRDKSVPIEELVNHSYTYIYIFHTRIGKNIYTYTARFAGDSMRKDIPC